MPITARPISAALVMAAAVVLSCTPARAQAIQSATSADEQELFMEDVRIQFHGGQFSRLDQMTDALLRSKSRFPGGDWRLNRIFLALSRPVDGDSDGAWKRHLALLAQWQKTQPMSSVPAIARGEAWYGFAWKARGNGYSNEVTRDGRRRFKERLAEAEKILNAAERVAARNPEWHVAMINLGRAQGWSRERIDGLLERAVAVEPLYFYTYNAAATYLLPRWYGKQGDWERFAETSSDRVGGAEGSAIYTYIAWRMAIVYGSREFLAQTNASWERIQIGFADWETLYGVTPQTLNGFAYLAGAAGDREVARDLLGRIGNSWDPAVWGDRLSFDSYRAWAFHTN